MCHAKAYHQQVKEAFPDLIQRILMVTVWMEPGDWIFWKHHRQKRVLEPSWKEPYQVLLTNDTAMTREGTESRVYISQLMKVPPDIWSCIDTGAPEVAHIRGDCFHPVPIKTSYLN